MVDGCTASEGHVGATPSQVSAISQIPAEARHGVVFSLTTSGGHVLETPSQVSATSQLPAIGRHVTPPLPATCVQTPVALQ
jgi:hypothetical protein